MKEVSFMETDKISNMIKKIRQKNNLSQQKFASIYNVSFQAVSKWENGKSIPDFMTLKKICDDYDIDINDLFEGKKKSKKKENCHRNRHNIAFGYRFSIASNLL